MKCGAILLMVVCVAACSSEPAGSDNTSTTFPAPVSPLPPPPGTIVIGQSIRARITVHGEEHRYQFVAPADGTLVAQLRWEGSKGRLLFLADSVAPSVQQTAVGRWPIVAAGKYELRVQDPAAWDYGDFFSEYVLTTQSER